MADAKMIEYRVDNGVAILEINRPPVNSYTTELLKELDESILEARFDENVHAIVLTGKVEKFFSAGADINMLSSKSLTFKNNFALHGHEVLMRLENTPKIVIAAINGHAVGGGLEIAMACDIRISKKEGGRVGLAEINLGVMPGMGGTQRLPRLVGKGLALEMMLTGEPISAQEAHRVGLVNKVVPAAGLMASAEKLAQQILSKAPLAVGVILEAVQHGMEMTLAEGLQLEENLFGVICGTEDMREGTAAFLDKRPANFQGK